MLYETCLVLMLHARRIKRFSEDVNSYINKKIICVRLTSLPRLWTVISPWKYYYLHINNVRLIVILIYRLSIGTV